MKAAVMNSGGDVTIEDVELEPLGPHDVYVETRAAVVCFTDAIARRGEFPVFNAPQIRGHGGVGIVTAIGSAVTRVRPGDRVIAAVRLQCGGCPLCLVGEAEWCDHSDGPPPRTVEVDGRVYRDREPPPPPVGRAASGAPLSAHARVGSYAEMMRLPDFVVTPITAAVSDAELALLGCGAGTGLGAVFNQADVHAGDTVAVVGCGVIGLSMIRAVRLLGAAQIYAVDPDANRRGLALAAGATAAYAPDDGALEGIIAGTRAVGADVALEAAGAPEAMELAFAATRRGGRVVLTGFGSPTATVSFGMNELAVRGRRVMGSQFGAVQVRRDLPRMAALMETGRLDLSGLTTNRYALADLQVAIDAVERREALGAVIDRF